MVLQIGYWSAYSKLNYVVKWLTNGIKNSKIWWFLYQ